MPTFTIIKNGLLSSIVKKHDRVIKVDGVDITLTATQQLEAFLSADESYIIGAYPSSEFKLIDGQPVNLSQSEFDALMPPLKPSPDTLIDILAADLKTSGIATTSTLPPQSIWTKADAKSAIDQAAGRARFRMASDGVFVDEEYAQTEQAVMQWRADGSPLNAVPDEVACWAEGNNWLTEGVLDYEQAAQDIEYNALGFKYLIALIRRYRLIGKCAVDAAEADFADVAQPFIDQLNAL